MSPEVERFKPFLPVELLSNEVDQILDLDRTALLFASRQSSQGRWLADASGKVPSLSRSGKTESRPSSRNGCASLGGRSDVVVMA